MVKFTIYVTLIVSIASHASGQSFLVNTPYRITSVSDNTVLDLSNWITTNGNTIQNWTPNTSTAQQWTFTAEQFGYRIASVVIYGNPPPCLPVITKNPTTTANDMFINCFYNGRNQVWEVILVGALASNQNIFVIRNTQANCILQNNGNAQRITCSTYDPNNILVTQRWTLVR